MSPYWATSLSVTLGPLPPIRDREPADRRGVELADAVLDARERLLEVPQAVGRGAELVAVLVVVALEPARADAEDRAPAGDVSSVRCASASSSRLRYLLQITSAPICTRSVTLAIAPSVAIASKCLPSASPLSG